MNPEAQRIHPVASLFFVCVERLGTRRGLVFGIVRLFLGQLEWALSRFLEALITATNPLSFRNPVFPIYKTEVE